MQSESKSRQLGEDKQEMRKRQDALKDNKLLLTRKYLVGSRRLVFSDMSQGCVGEPGLEKKMDESTEKLEIYFRNIHRDCWFVTVR